MAEASAADPGGQGCVHRSRCFLRSHRALTRPSAVLNAGRCFSEASRGRLMKVGTGGRSVTSGGDTRDRRLLAASATWSLPPSPQHLLLLLTDKLKEHFGKYGTIEEVVSGTAAWEKIATQTEARAGGRAAARHPPNALASPRCTRRSLCVTVCPTSQEDSGS